MEEVQTPHKSRRIAGTVLILVPGLAVAASETLKFAAVPAVVSQMAAAGFSSGKLLLVAALGMSSALLFLYSRTRPAGVLLLSSFLGGAICVHVQMGEFTKAVAPSALLALSWIGTWLRHPDLMSFKRNPAAAHADAHEKRRNWVSEGA